MHLGTSVAGLIHLVVAFVITSLRGCGWVSLFVCVCCVLLIQPPPPCMHARVVLLRVTAFVCVTFGVTRCVCVLGAGFVCELSVLQGLNNHDDGSCSVWQLATCSPAGGSAEALGRSITAAGHFRDCCNEQ